MGKQSSVVIALIFCAAILAGALSGLLLPDRFYSESERRTLTQAPRLTGERVLSGRFGRDVESYLADQFPLRDQWIALKTLTELASGKRESGGVYFCDDGYLIEAFTRCDAAQYEANLAALKAFSDGLTESGVDVRIMLVPGAAEILTDKLPALAPCADQSKLLESAAAAGLRLVDAAGALREHRGEYIYYKTDHHYTSLGAYYCYAAWKQSKGEAAAPLAEWTAEALCDDFRGTTYSKVNYPFAAYDVITAYYREQNHIVNYNGGTYVADSIYERKYLDGQDKYAVFLNSNQAVTVVTGKGEGNLLILKDSYANSFAQFVVDEYAQTHLLDLRFFNSSAADYIAANDIAEVLVLYGLPSFVADTSIAKLVRDVTIEIE
ncbi:MAG: DHHW family protein [Clostridia bacterium]|nr:DHHW family protein [Clostridia bacterium]